MFALGLCTTSSVIPGIVLFFWLTPNAVPMLSWSCESKHQSLTEQFWSVQSIFLYEAEVALPQEADTYIWFYLLVLFSLVCDSTQCPLTFGILSNPSISKLPSPCKWSLESSLSSKTHALLALGLWNPAVKGACFWKRWSRGIAVARAACRLTWSWGRCECSKLCLVVHSLFCGPGIELLAIVLSWRNSESVFYRRLKGLYCTIFSSHFCLLGLWKWPKNVIP